MLSIARLNSASSRVRASSCSRIRIRLQFLALGLITVDSLQTVSKTKALFWRLTDAGKTLLLQELLVKLGIRVSRRTVGKYVPKRPPGRPRGDQRWSTFLKNHAKAIVACDLFVAVTATFRMLYVFIVIEHGTRRLVHVSVTTNPSVDWTLQQLREVVGNGGGHRYLIHDRDRIFAKHLDDSIRALGVEVLRSPIASPKANSLCERVIGTARRECLDSPADSSL